MLRCDTFERHRSQPAVSVPIGKKIHIRQLHASASVARGIPEFNSGKGAAFATRIWSDRAYGTAYIVRTYGKESVMNRWTYAVAAAALGGLAVVGCDKDDTRTSSTTTTQTRYPSTTSTAPAVGVDVDVNKDKLKNMANRTGDAIERGADKTVEVAKEAGHDTKEGLKTAGQKIDNAVDRTRDKANDAAQQAGSRDTAAPNGTAAAPDAEGVRDVLAQVAEASLTKGRLDSVVERLAEPDRSRLSQSLQKDDTELDGRIDQFRKDWKAKYNQDFDIKNEEQVYPNSQFMISQGGAAPTGVDRATPGALTTGRTGPGHDSASVRIQGLTGMPELTVPLVHEAPDRWRIDVPDTLTADKLRANVLAHLTAADEMKDQWPADVNQAYAQVTHHVLMALMDQPVQK
jgi:hypothetical protein